MSAAYFISVFVAVIQCPPVGAWNDIESDTNETLIGTVINITCTKNMKFANTESSAIGEKVSPLYRLSVCGINGAWNPSLPACISKMKHHGFVCSRLCHLAKADPVNAVEGAVETL